MYVLIEFLLQEQAQTENLSNLNVDKTLSYTPARTKRINDKSATCVNRYKNSLIDQITFLLAVGYCLHCKVRVQNNVLLFLNFKMLLILKLLHLKY